VHIKKEALKSFNFPATIEKGTIKSLEAKIPWRNLSSSPVELTLSGFELVMQTIDESDWSTTAEKL